MSQKPKPTARRSAVVLTIPPVAASVSTASNARRGVCSRRPRCRPRDGEVVGDVDELVVVVGRRQDAERLAALVFAGGVGAGIEDRAAVEVDVVGIANGGTIAPLLSFRCRRRSAICEISARCCADFVDGDETAVERHGKIAHPHRRVARRARRGG